MWKVTYRIKGDGTEHFKVFANRRVADSFAAELGYYLISLEEYHG
jgi:hypothetical protein